MYACPTCGGGLVFDPKTQMLLCKSCRNKFEPENIENMRLDKAKETGEQTTKNSYEAISYKCSHCGAELITTDETITTFCSFCRTGTMLDRKIVQKRKPDYVIPFLITKEECEQIYLNKIKHAFFAPKSMIDTQEVKKIRGIYMPYWIYSFEKHGNVDSNGRKYSHRSGDYVYYDDYSLSTDLDASCKGITHDAASDFSDRLSEAIAPYSSSKKKAFSPAYLSGFYADSEDVDEGVYLDESKTIANNDISNKLSREKEYRNYSARPSVSMEEANAELALFPVYYLATKNKSGDRISYAVINGQTGKIAADIPIDFKKFIMFSLALAIPIFILLNFTYTFNMMSMAVLSLIFNIISLLVLINQNIKIKKRETKLDDKGAQYKAKNLKNDVVESKRKMGIYMPVVGLIITVLVFCLKPASDLYYYLAAFASIGTAILSFSEIIKKYNILTSKKLPQLGKRGGDENA